MWQGKEQPPPLIDVHYAAKCAIYEALQTNTLEQLVHLVRAPCREAGFEAARNKCDMNAQLKREYYGMVMDMLQGEKWPAEATACRTTDHRIQRT